MPKLPAKKTKAKGLLKTLNRLKEPTPEREKGNPASPLTEQTARELKEAVHDLNLEMQQLNSNIGKLYNQLSRTAAIQRKIEDDDIPF